MHAVRAANLRFAHFLQALPKLTQHRVAPALHHRSQSSCGVNGGALMYPAVESPAGSRRLKTEPSSTHQKVQMMETRSQQECQRPYEARRSTGAKVKSYPHPPFRILP